MAAYPTANVFYPYIVNVNIVLREAQKSRNPYLMSMADAMLDKFDKYWEEKNNLMVIATILDPIFKMRYITWCFGEIYPPYRCMKELEDIDGELEELYMKYNKLIDNGKGSAQSSSSSRNTCTSLTSVVPSGFQSFLQSNSTEVSKSELLIYLEEAHVSIDDKTFNLLDYWKVNSNAHRFLVLAAMAKSFLAVPASSVSSEPTFSTGGRILDDYRSSLKPATVQALVCASSWIRASQNDNNTPILAVCNGSPILFQFSMHFFIKFVCDLFLDCLFLQEQDEDDDVESVDFPNSIVGSN